MMQTPGNGLLPKRRLAGTARQVLQNSQFSNFIAAGFFIAFSYTGNISIDELVA